MLSIASGALWNGGRDLGLLSVPNWKQRKLHLVVCAVSTKQKVHTSLQTAVSVSSINILVDM